MDSSTTYILYGIVLLLLTALIYAYFNIVKQRKQIKKLQLRVRRDEEIKSNFLTQICHALRIPLLVINDYLKGVQTKGCENMSDEERQNVMMNIYKNSSQMFSYLDELQELTNFEGSIPALSMIEVNLAELIMSYRREILHETQRGVTVCIRSTMSPHCKANLDTTMFRQLMMHLLRLGAQRTSEGEIAIEYCWENEGLRFDLIDTGFPIREEIRDILFTNQLKAEDIKQMEEQSTYISLCMCKSIVDSMNGTIQAIKPDNDKGAHISFWIPCYVRFN
ncbi:MAG: HAMP domain-containing histidine kinase [Bacteroidaceae bacterium]|nr:HAMP domain-containing histidine kinase [Bacteroidaceae bacterium]